MKPVRAIVPCLALALFLSVSAHAATGYFLKIGDIDGESQDEHHQDWIELVGFNHKITQAVSHDNAQAGGRQPLREHHSDITVTKELDKSTPLLMRSCSQGTTFPEVTITLLPTSSTGPRTPYLTYKLKNVLVTSYSVSGTEGDAKPRETLSLNYEKITWTYNKLSSDDGTTEETVKSGWDRTAHHEYLGDPE